MVTCGIKANGTKCTGKAVAMLEERIPCCKEHARDYFREGRDKSINHKEKD